MRGETHRGLKWRPADGVLGKTNDNLQVHETTELDLHSMRTKPESSLFLIYGALDDMCIQATFKINFRLTPYWNATRQSL